MDDLNKVPEDTIMLNDSITLAASVAQFLSIMIYLGVQAILLAQQSLVELTRS